MMMTVSSAHDPRACPDRRRDPDRGRPPIELHGIPDEVRAQLKPSFGGESQDRFAEAVGPHLGRLGRLARRILRCDDLADDAVQEALISLWTAGRLPPNPSGWLTRAVVHRSLHLNRCRRRRRVYEERACARRFECVADEDASRALEAEELGLRIDAALARLPAHFREVFVLREVERMDYESIAGRLRVPVGTVRSRLSRSREALQRTLGGRDC